MNANNYVIIYLKWNLFTARNQCSKVNYITDIRQIDNKHNIHKNKNYSLIKNNLNR